jgi:hypothetical protein
VVDRHGHGRVGGERGAGDGVAEGGRVARGGGGVGGVAEGVAERVVQARAVVRGRRRRPRARARGEQPRRAAAHGIRRSGSSVSGGGKASGVEYWSTSQATPSALFFFYQYAALAEEETRAACASAPWAMTTSRRLAAQEPRGGRLRKLLFLSVFPANFGRHEPRRTPSPGGPRCGKLRH